MKQKCESESGQILIIMTVGIIALLGFAALAIDGGMLYSNRRYDQNAADNAVIAAASQAGNMLFADAVDWETFDCQSNMDVQDAIDQAYGTVLSTLSSYGLSTYNTGAQYDAGNNGVYIQCFEGANQSENYLLVKVKITSDTQPHLSQLVFQQVLRSTVEAVTRLEPGVNNPSGPVLDGMGLVALSDDDDSAIFGNGNSTLTVIGSGIHSNSGFTGKNVTVVSDLGIRYTAGFNHQVKKVTCLDQNGNPTSDVNKCLKTAEGKYEMTISGFPEACYAAGMQDRSSPGNKGGTIVPGRYNGIKVTSGNLVMEPGLYCISGTVDLKGKVTVSGDENDGVTIYYTGSSWTLNGGADTSMRAPRQGATGSGLAVPGLLIYAPNTATVKWNGGSTNYFRGTLAMPKSDVTLNGNSDSGAWAAQFIGDTFKFTGGMSLTLDSTEDDLFWDVGEVSQPRLDVYQ